MLNEQQQIYLRGVAKHGTEEIDKVVRVLRHMSPELFFHETRNKDHHIIPDPKMKERKFFDQPTSLVAGESYDSHEVDALDPHLRYAQYEARSMQILRRGMGYK